jgi:hypothetical protein
MIFVTVFTVHITGCRSRKFSPEIIGTPKPGARREDDCFRSAHKKIKLGTIKCGNPKGIISIMRHRVLRVVIAPAATVHPPLPIFS